MDRRELLKMIAALTGGVVIGGEVFLSGCKTGGKAAEAGFSPANIALLDEVGETIIPATSTPGAKATQIGEFMKVMVNDCYTENQQMVFTKGISDLEEACQKANGKSFVDCTPQQRHDFLVGLEKESKEHNAKADADDKPKEEAIKSTNRTVPYKEQKEFEATPRHYYTMMKQLTLLGFFTSKTGMTETLRHIPVPGKFDGAFPYKKGDKAWAE